MRRFLIFTAFVAVLLAVCGCSKEYPVAPVFGKVYVSKSPLQGESFKVLVQVMKPGSGFYRSYYTVRISKGGNEVINTTVKVLGSTVTDPVVLEDAKFALPEKGTYNISCTVELNTSTPFPDGTVAVSPSIAGSTFAVN